MIKRIIVAGCRDYEDYDEAKAYIEMCIKKIRKEHTLIFLSGGCRGADMLGERYAHENGFCIEHYPANWQKYGKSAGPKRNLQMAEACDYVICFWDGKSYGTASMISCAKRLHKPLKIKKYNSNRTHSPAHQKAAQTAFHKIKKPPLYRVEVVTQLQAQHLN